MKQKTYILKEKTWIYPGDFANWYFVTIPKLHSQEIKEKYGKNAKGFGSLPVTVTVGKTAWKTSIFPDRRSGTYLLPLKAKVRKAEEVEAGEYIKFSISVLV
jgi:hypothetical protein